MSTKIEDKFTEVNMLNRPNDATRCLGRAAEANGDDDTPVVAPPTLRPVAPPTAPEPWTARPRRWMTISGHDGRAIATVDGWDAAFVALAGWRCRGVGMLWIEDLDGRTLATAIVDDRGTATMMLKV